MIGVIKCRKFAGEKSLKKALIWLVSGLAKKREKGLGQQIQPKLRASSTCTLNPKTQIQVFLILRIEKTAVKHWYWYSYFVITTREQLSTVYISLKKLPSLPSLITPFITYFVDLLIVCPACGVASAPCPSLSRSF